MPAEENKQAAKDGYEAFGRGDAEGAMENISDSIEWVVPGDSAVSGTYRGKEELGKFWGQIGEKGFQTKPFEFLADGDKVVVLTEDSAGGEKSRAVDVLTYDTDGQLTRFETFGGEKMLDRVFPK